MPTLRDLKDQKEEIASYDKRIEGLLKANAEPYENFPQQDKYKETTYEVPEGMSERDAMALTLGAIFDPAITNAMYTSSNAAGSTKEIVHITYVMQNVFGGKEPEQRLGNVPTQMAIARENAAKAFEAYADGDIEPLQELGKNFITKLYSVMADKDVARTGPTYAFGVAVKLAWNLIQNPDLGLEDVLEENNKQQIRAFLSAYEKMEMSIDAEIELHENLPEKNSPERDELLKKAWLNHALQNKYSREIDQRNSEIENYGYQYLIEEEKKYGFSNKMIKDAVMSPIRVAYNGEVFKNTTLPMQMILGNEENEEIAIDAYWEEIKKTALYEQLMEADQDTFFNLYEKTKKEELPEIHEFDEILEEIEINNDEVKDVLAEKFREQVQEVSAKVGARIQSDIRKEELLNQLKKEQASDRLIGSMKSMHEYVNELKELKVKEVDLEKYKKYLESMERIVEKTEEFYQTYEDGTYVPLTAEGLKEIQGCYKDAYATAKEMGIAKVCKLLEGDIAILGTLDKKNLTTLPDAIEEAKTVSLDISGSQLATVGGQASSRIPLRYTDVNGKEVTGYFTEQEQKLASNVEFDRLLSKLESKHPHMKTLGAFFKEEEKKKPGFCEMFTWSILMDTSTTGLSAEEARDVFFNDVCNEMEDKLEPFMDTLMEHKEEAISYFVELTSKMSTIVFQNRIYCEGLKLSDRMGIKIDNRNAAMSSVADMLGMPDIIAKSQSMELRNGNTVIKGTFMQQAEGIDISNMPEDHPMRAYKDEVYDQAVGIKSLADIQVLDYICMNIDRHAANMLYKFDTSIPGDPKFIGVQGIDNDASFGLMTEDKDIDIDGNVTRLENLGIISKSVYDSIMDMDMELFQIALKKQELTDPEIQAACTRMQKLKDKVAEDAKYFEQKEPGELEAGRIRVLSDEDFTKLTIDKVLENAPNAMPFMILNNYIKGGVSYLENELLAKIKNESAEIKKIVNAGVEQKVELNISEINLGSKQYYTKLQRDLSELLLESVRNDSVLRGSSKEYKEVQRTLKESIDILGKMEQPGEEKIQKLTESLQAVAKASREYEKHKSQKSSGSDYEKSRKNVIASIKDSVLGKVSAIEAEKDKYLSKQQEISNRQTNREANKHQIKTFVSNLMNWNEQQPKENTERALAAAILVGTMEEYAFKCFGVGKEDKVFQMTQEQFEKKITELTNSTKFKDYYQNIDKELLKEDLASQKSIESYLEDFRKGSVQPEQTPQMNQEIVEKEVNGPNMT